MPAKTLRRTSPPRLNVSLNSFFCLGHFFGGNHLPCPQNGGLAPVMMQQTLSTANNDLADLTTQNPQGIVIPRDGKVCQPNPWPFPVAGQGQ